MGLYEDAIRLARTLPQGASLATALAAIHGSAGAVVGTLSDVMAGGRVRSPMDVNVGYRTAVNSGYIRPGLTDRTDFSGPRVSLPPVVPPRFNPVNPVAIVPLGQQFQPVGEDPRGVIRVGTLPTRETLESPPVQSQVPPVGDFPPSPRGRRPGGAGTQPGGGTDQQRGRSPLEVKTVPRPGERRGRPPGYNDYIHGAMMPPDVDDEDVFGDEILTPQSSNVYSVAYDSKRGILYVAYRMPGEAVGYREWTNQCNGRDYRLAIRPFERGPLYAYGSKARPIPAWMWEELQQAESKGSWIWSRLRVCGSYFQHQFPYALVSPGMEGSLYIPRKATQKGWRVRTVPYAGKGKRPWLRTDLPDNPWNQS